MKLPKNEWHTVCTSPCDREVSIDGDYRIAGDGVHASRPFQIEARAGQRVVMEVDAGSRGGFVGGIVLTAASPGIALAGIGIAALAEHSKTASDVGLGLVLGGVVGLVIGLVMLGTSITSQSQQIQNSAPPQPPAQPPAAFAPPALVRF
jgi:hypothetical protein